MLINACSSNILEKRIVYTYQAEGTQSFCQDVQASAGQGPGYQHG